MYRGRGCRGTIDVTCAPNVKNKDIKLCIDQTDNFFLKCRTLPMDPASELEACGC